MTSSLWRHTFNISWHFSCKNNWHIVFFLFAKFGVDRVNTFEVMRNNVKYPRNRETFGGWFGPYQWLVVEPGQCVTGVFFYFKTKKNSCLRSESYISAFLLLSINTHQFACSPFFWDRVFPSRVLFFWPSELHRNEMVDCFENLFVEVNPEKPFPKNSSSDDENLLDVNFWFHCCILLS